MKIILNKSDLENIVIDYLHELHSIDGEHIRDITFNAEECTVEINEERSRQR